MAFRAKPGCVEHYIAVLERVVNSFSPYYLLAPVTGEIFNNLDHYNLRLYAFALA
jgi:hypothetical protein